MLLRKKKNKIGIMQGRLFPNEINRLQVFPSSWKHEFAIIKDLGFDYIELLDDKEGQFRKILKTTSIEFFSELNSYNLPLISVCLDRLCNFSLFNDSYYFCKEIDEFLTYFTTDDKVILVIPFFDINHINSKEEFEKCLEMLSRYDTQLKDRNIHLSLEVDLDATTISNVFKCYNFNNIGVCYDFGNSIQNEFDLKRELLVLQNHINHIHVKDKYNGVNIRLRKNNKQLINGFDTLMEIGYKDGLCLETNIKPDPISEAEINLTTVLELMRT